MVFQHLRLLVLTLQQRLLLCFVAGAGSITFTLPSGPSAGDFVVIKDGTGAAATTNFTVARHGSNIAIFATDLTFDKNFAQITMTYMDATIGWSV